MADCNPSNTIAKTMLELSLIGAYGDEVYSVQTLPVEIRECLVIGGNMPFGHHDSAFEDQMS
ncbi:hypothetical protein CTI12_AA419130 [Artemisia annua]|uniref:Uncharacterized protein n=1 Tax=Artemisia annua TaxID=35608 RepID=A0A2U1LYY9_ARTAN|nr:hypothetical protein CTI12_AA419130 [Artemisia annua]